MPQLPSKAIAINPNFCFGAASLTRKGIAERQAFVELRAQKWYKQATIP